MLNVICYCASYVFGLSQLITDHTRFTVFSITLIDLVLIDSYNCVGSDINISDVVANHFIIYFVLKFKAKNVYKVQKITIITLALITPLFYKILNLYLKKWCTVLRTLTQN